MAASKSNQEIAKATGNLVAGMTEAEARHCPPDEAFRIAHNLVKTNLDKPEADLKSTFKTEVGKLVHARSKPGSFAPDFAASSENIAQIVSRQGFSGEAMDIARRQLSLVQEQRPVRVVKAILEVMGGPGATFPDILSNSVGQVLEKINSKAGDKAIRETPENVVSIVNMTVQQTAFLVQKTIAVAIDDLRNADSTDPKYPYR